jgi:hypothetical protein
MRLRRNCWWVAAVVVAAAIGQQALRRPPAPAAVANEPATATGKAAERPEAEAKEEAEPEAEAKKQAAERAPAYVQERLRGKVVWLGEALKRLYDIEIDADAARSQVVLETTEGAIHPLVKDSRGRAFYIDEHWREIEMELLVRRQAGSPYVRVIRVYTIKPEGKFDLDYWCDICAIAMYEKKSCECCQGESRIRERLVKDEQNP